MIPSNDLLTATMNTLNTHIGQLSDAGTQYYYFGLVSSHRDNVPHQHSFFECCYVFQGEGLYIENGKTYSLRPGCLFLSRPGISHQITRGRNLGLYYVAYRITDAASETLRHHYQIAINSSDFLTEQAQNTAIVWIWQSLISEGAHADHEMMPTLRSLCNSLISLIPKHIVKSGYGPSHEDQSLKDKSMYIKQAKLYIRDNFSRQLGIEEVADYLYISSRHLSRLFQETQSGTFTNFLLQVRLENAVQLLTNTDLSIQSIAENCGFGSVHYFTRVFARELGKPPAKYRKQYRYSSSDELLT